MLTHITFVRHGETSWNATGRWQGHAFVPLNDEGRRQAARLAQHLIALAGEISAIYCSDLARALETAQIIAATLEKSVLVDERLREIDMGEWQGLTGDEIKAWDSERYHKILNGSEDLARPGGESWQQVNERSLAVVEEILAVRQGQHVLVVSHGGTIRSLLKHLGLLGSEHVRISNTSQTRIIHHHGNTPAWALDVVNAMTHLESPETSDSHER
jgi:broad specificity phosphatase PhoE